ncbi:MAG: 1,4-dihydroxy-2-naphthoyl-CoA hydrolase [Bacteroidia bacterium]|nr:MAG: 1,4-dihydroxy-2-naphthoyl-CoA hydrolase [Bacteroidia bacterium]
MTFQPLNPNFKATIKQKLKGQHFMHLIGFDLTRIEFGVVEGQMNLENKHLQQFGFVHGGATSTILDITMGFAAYSVVPIEKGVVTANISIDFLNPGDGDKIIAIGEVEKAGNKLVFTHGRVFTEKDGQRKLIATARSVMAIIDVPN